MMKESIFVLFLLLTIISGRFLTTTENYEEHSEIIDKGMRLRKTVEPTSTMKNLRRTKREDEGRFLLSITNNMVSGVIRASGFVRN